MCNAPFIIISLLTKLIGFSLFLTFIKFETKISICVFLIIFKSNIKKSITYDLENYNCRLPY